MILSFLFLIGLSPMLFLAVWATSSRKWSRRNTRATERLAHLVERQWDELHPQAPRRKMPALVPFYGLVLLALVVALMSVSGCAYEARTQNAWIAQRLAQTQQRAFVSTCIGNGGYIVDGACVRPETGKLSLEPTYSGPPSPGPYWGWQTATPAGRNLLGWGWTPGY